MSVLVDCGIIWWVMCWGDGDSIGSLASRFGVGMDNIEALNGITNPSNVTVSALYYIHLNTGMKMFLISIHDFMESVLI